MTIRQLATDVHQPYLSQAMDIINATNDGEDLDPADLRLTQDVVNGFELSERGEAYWASLHAAAVGGSYVKRSFCGIPGLTQDAEGYVSWKGAVVEHYSFAPERKDEMVRSARILAAVCLTLEQRGTAVSWPNISSVLDEIAVGQGRAIPRYAVHYTVSAFSPNIRISALTADTAQELAEERRVLGEAAMAAFGADVNSLRSVMVVTGEDLESLKESIVGDLAWRERAFASRVSDTHDCRRQFMSEIDRKIGQPLRPLSELRASVLGAHLDQVTRQSEQSMASDPLQANRHERARA